MATRIFFPIRRKHFIAATLTGLTTISVAATTQAASDPYISTNGTSDLAQAWIDYLFRANSLPETIAPYAAPLSAAAEGLRHGLGLYSMGMLIFAALLVFYHIAVMVVETAHYGVAFGRRANQIWMPLRFVFAVGLLVPVSSSLSAGQYLVLKIAEEGSSLASNAWREIAQTAAGHLSGLVAPRGPDVAHLVATAVEMETCRMVYEQLYTPLENDPTVHMAGLIGSPTKIPADHFVSETWRYSNSLNATIPLCGEYRFSGYRQPLLTVSSPPDAVSRLAESLSGFAHEQADDLLSQAHMIASRIASGFTDEGIAPNMDIRDELAGLEKTYQGHLEAKQRIMGSAGSELADKALTDSANAGWLAAASFIPELVQLQESYSEMVSHALPDAQSPVLAHPVLARAVLKENLDLLFASHAVERTDLSHLIDFYLHASRQAAQVHGWLYTGQLSDKDFVAPSSGDLHDHVNAATDPDAIFSFFARALDASAMAHGVWGEDAGSYDIGYPFALIPDGALYNPFAALVEYGRRQIDLAASLAGLAGSGVSLPGAAGPSALLGLAGLGFFAGGLLLIFAVPLLPFLRFLMGALAWGLALFEGIVAMPLVALAHLTPGGEGLSGGMGRQAYLLWFGLMVRPLLTVFGLVLGLLLFTLSLAFLNAVLAPFARLGLASNSGLLVVGNTGFIFLYDILVFGAANASFKGISWLPDKALRWVTSFTVTDGGDAPAPAGSGAAGPAGSAGLSHFIGQQMAGLMGNAGFGKSGTGSTSSTTSAAAQSHSMKMALFPAYGEGGSGGAAGSSTTTTSTTSTTSTTQSTGAMAGSMGNIGTPNVNVSVTPGGIGTDGKRIYTGKTDGSPFRQDKHNASMGGKERTGSEGDPKPDLPKAPDTPKD